MQRESQTARFLYSVVAVLTIAFLLYALFVLHLEYWIILVLLAISRGSLYYFATRVIRKRKFEAIATLQSRWSAWDYSAIVLTILAGVYYFSQDTNSNNSTSLTLVILLLNSIRNPWSNYPAFVITKDKVYQNEFFMKERQLDHLHRIELTSFPRGFTIYFAEDYALKINKGGNTEKELCDFVTAIIDQSPVDPDMQPEAERFLAQHSVSA